MKVNITLLTMITWAARRKRAPPAEPAGTSEAGMGVILGRGVPRRRARRPCNRRVGPFNLARALCRGLPTGLADGLGFESTLVRAGPAPRSRPDRVGGSPVSHRAVW